MRTSERKDFRRLFSRTSLSFKRARSTQFRFGRLTPSAGCNKKPGRFYPARRIVSAFELRRWKTLDRLPHQEAPGHAKRAEGCAEQHYRGAAVRSPGPARAKECPTRKAISIPLCGDGEAG
jgi:hypothetical protein